MKLLKSYRIFFFSMAFSFLLWFYVKLAFQYQEVMDIPLQVINAPEGYGIVSPLPEKVPVRFEGDGKSLLGVRFFFDTKYVLDLTKFKPDPWVVLSQYLENVQYPHNEVKVVEILLHDSLRIRAEKLITQRVPVHPVVIVTCAPGYAFVGGAVAHPDSVAVTFPVSLKDSVKFVATVPAIYNDLSSDKIIALKLSPFSNSLVHYEIVDVRIDLDIQPLGETLLENIPVKLIHAPANQNIIVQPSTFSIKVRGGVDLLANLPKDSILGVIDYVKEQELGHVQSTLTIIAPMDIAWSQVTPARFKLIRLQ